MKNTIILIDDHPLFRSGLRDTIINNTQYKVIGEFSTGKDFIACIHTTLASVIIIDISLPDISGLELLGKIKNISPSTKCIMMTMYENEEYALRALELGASAYIIKTDDQQSLLDCLCVVESGSTYVSENIESYNTKAEINTSMTTKLAQLSNKESIIMLFIAQGKTSKEIAEQLNLSLRTIQNHRNNICRKLKIQGANSLLKLAVENEHWLKKTT